MAKPVPPDITKTAADKQAIKSTALPIDEAEIPDDVSDLGDVVDAINKLCETMKSSTYEETEEVISSDGMDQANIESLNFTSNIECENVTPIDISTTAKEEHEVVSQQEVIFEKMTLCSIQKTKQSSDVTFQTPKLDDLEITSDTEITQLYEPIRVALQKVDVSNGERTERWSDTISQISMPVDDAEITSDTEVTHVQCEPTSEMYYTASSEVSLISEELPDKGQNDKEEKKEGVIAGHVAAMRERFESMTRANTPCTDLRSSPSDLFRNITPSPDRLG